MEQQKTSTVNYNQLWEINKYRGVNTLELKVEERNIEDNPLELDDNLKIEDKKFQDVIKVFEDYKENPETLKEIIEVAWKELTDAQVWPPLPHEYKNIQEYNEVLSEFFKSSEKLSAEIKNKKAIYPKEMNVFNEFLHTHNDYNHLMENRKNFLSAVSNELQKIKNIKQQITEQLNDFIADLAWGKPSEMDRLKERYLLFTAQEREYVEKNAFQKGKSYIEEVFEEVLSNDAKKSLEDKFNDFFNSIEQYEKQTINNKKKWKHNKQQSIIKQCGKHMSLIPHSPY